MIHLFPQQILLLYFSSQARLDPSYSPAFFPATGSVAICLLRLLCVEVRDDDSSFVLIPFIFFTSPPTPRPLAPSPGVAGRRHRRSRPLPPPTRRQCPRRRYRRRASGPTACTTCSGYLLRRPFSCSPSSYPTPTGIQRLADGTLAPTSIQGLPNGTHAVSLPPG